MGIFLAHFMVARKIALLLWSGCQGTQMNNCHENLNTCFTKLNGIWWNKKKLVAMENVKKCTVAMLGRPCSQHVTGNTSRPNQPQRYPHPSNPLQWRHSGHDNVSNHQPHDCLLNRLFRRRSKKIPKLRVTGLCEFPAQMTSNAENVSIWWRHHAKWKL